jgi:hypothetical protein
LRCRLRATGWLFGLDLKQLHGICVPSGLSRDRWWRRPPLLASVKSASHFIEVLINFKW